MYKTYSNVCLFKKKKKIFKGWGLMAFKEHGHDWWMDIKDHMREKEHVRRRHTSWFTLCMHKGKNKHSVLSQFSAMEKLRSM